MAIIKNPLTLMKGSSCVLLSKVISENGTYNAIDDDADGYSSVEVSVAGGGGGSDRPFNLLSYLYLSLTEINDEHGDILGVGDFGYPSALGRVPSMQYQPLSYMNMPSCSVIGGYAIASCSLLQSISLPECKQIWHGAFYNCVSLSSTLTLPKCEVVSQGAFSSCALIQSVSLPECSIIHPCAFANTSINYLCAPKCLSLGNSCLGNTLSKSIYIASDKCYIADNCGQRIISYGDYNRWLRYMSFNDNPYYCYVGCWGNSGINTITLHPSCVTVASPVSFYGWNSPSVIMMDLSNVTYLPYRAFYSVYARPSLKTIVGSHVTEIGSSCFYLSQNYGSFTSLIFSALESLPSYMVYGNSVARITTLTTSYLKYIGTSALYNCAGLLGLSISPDCSEIGAAAFSNCYKMVLNSGGKVKLNILSSIGNYAFIKCSSITNMYMPKVTSLNGYNFQYDYSLGFIRLVDVSDIGGYVFNYCSRLSKLEVLGESVPTVMNTAFGNCGLDTSTTLGYFGSIYVRNSLIDSFKVATNWASLSARMVGMYSFKVDDATYWGAVGSTYGQWVADTYDNEDDFVVSGTSIITSDGTQYVGGMTSDSLISDGATFSLVNI